jgi:hypothetical protein
MFELSDIKNRSQWHEFMKRARLRTSELLRTDPTWDLALTVAERLDEMNSAVSNDRVPTAAEKDFGKGLGVLAVRNFDDSDPDYSYLLKELSYAFKYWENIPK